MKVFTWVNLDADPLPQRLALCYWFHAWKDAGFDPHIVTPEMRGPGIQHRYTEAQMLRLVKASGQSFDHWAKWRAPLLDAHGPPVLIVDATILPLIQASKMLLDFREPFARYDTQGRVILARNSPFMQLIECFKHGKSNYREFGGQPFTDWDLVLLDYPFAPTIDATTDNYVAANHLFRNYSQSDILELRAKRLAI